MTADQGAETRAAEELAVHRYIETPECVALCACGTGGAVRALSEIPDWHGRHLAHVLADAGLLREPIAEPAPDVAEHHHPRVEEIGPGKPDALACVVDDQEWPCDHERDMRREEPT